eukprot:15364801-Ditylum_brightwellii.AAC.1
MKRYFVTSMDKAESVDRITRWSSTNCMDAAHGCSDGPLELPCLFMVWCSTMILEHKERQILALQGAGIMVYGLYVNALMMVCKSQACNNSEPPCKSLLADAIFALEQERLLMVGLNLQATELSSLHYGKLTGLHCYYMKINDRVSDVDAYANAFEDPVDGFESLKGHC